jgi:hypothetical protein
MRYLHQALSEEDEEESVMAESGSKARTIHSSVLGSAEEQLLHFPGPTRTCSHVL